MNKNTRQEILIPKPFQD